LGKYDSAYTSEDGSLCLVYSRKEREALVLDKARNRVGGFTTGKSYAGLQISSGALVTVYSEVAINPPEKTDFFVYRKDGTVLFSMKGVLLHSGNVALEFPPSEECVVGLGDSTQYLVAADQTCEVRGVPIAFISGLRGTEMLQALPPGFQTSDVSLDSKARQVAFTVSRYRADAGAERFISYTFVYNRATREWKVVRHRDLRMFLPEDTVCFSPDGGSLYAAGRATLQKYDLQTGKLQWACSVAGTEGEDRGVDIGVFVGVLGAYAISAHRAGGPKPSCKYVISFVSQQTGQVKKRYVTTPQRYPFEEHIWFASRDGNGIVLNFPDPVAVPLPD